MTPPFLKKSIPCYDAQNYLYNSTTVLNVKEKQNEIAPFCLCLTEVGEDVILKANITTQHSISNGVFFDKVNGNRWQKR